jgi:hypothetical protein
MDDSYWKATAEATKWLGDRDHRRRHIVLYEGNAPVGFTITLQEADAICQKHPQFQWDFSKKLPVDRLWTLSTVGLEQGE